MKIIKKLLIKPIKFIYFFIRWLLIQPLCLLFYERKYLKGKWFSDGVFSLGWQWCWNDIVHRILFGIHWYIPFPLSPYIDCTPDIDFDPDDINNFQGYGTYFQAFNGARIKMGKGCYIAKNVGIITVNHDLHNPEKHQYPKNVELGDNCWIGMNAIILPGVTLGPHTVVGAGSVVTKSFSDGWSVIAGNPAKIINKIEKNY